MDAASGAAQAKEAAEDDEADQSLRRQDRIAVSLEKTWRKEIF